jgi:hypothetical protein
LELGWFVGEADGCDDGIQLGLAVVGDAVGLRVNSTFGLLEGD